jgi:hypothetical protein
MAAQPGATGAYRSPCDHDEAALRTQSDGYLRCSGCPSKCQQPTRKGTACRNTPSMMARPPYATAPHSDLMVCGVHANSLWQENWRPRDPDDWTWQQRFEVNL